ncbi:HU family DNA-binding protein [Porphyromonas pogonae]|uniref:HU family DNA-binding protein n=1 Tax=Porphyromonas pogonae TaxID=867595 RepID=UPI002E7A62BC|nr:HU family DNA-binding protein [Porphyromonas pogonae]
MNFNLSKSVAKVGQNKGKVVYFAKPEKVRTISFDEVVTDISDAGSLTVGDVRSAIERLSYILRRELLRGNSVCLNDLGTYRFSFGSKQHTDPEKVDSSSVKKPRLVVAKSKAMRQALTGISINVMDTDKLKPSSKGNKPDNNTPVNPNPGVTPGTGL